VEQTSFNSVLLIDSPMGIVATGVAAGYAREAVRDLGLDTKVNFWKVGVVYPLHPVQAQRFLDACEKVLVIEEGGAMVEPQLRAMAQQKGQNARISGKQFDGPLPPTGELSADQVRDVIAAFCGASVGRDDVRQALKAELAELVIPRSPTLCAGCSHLGTYWAIRQAMQQGGRIVPIINGDIGCYEQAGYGVKGQMLRATDEISRRDRLRSLYDMLDTLYVMGSGLAMAQGQARASYQDGQIMAVAGDSTFFHATMPALENAVWNGTKLTFVVMDNRWTAMTGHQSSPTTTESDDKASSSITTLDIEQAVRGLGVKWGRGVDPDQLEETIDTIQEALEYDGVAVVISRRECALQVYRRMRQTADFVVDAELCNGCRQCVYLGCPAIAFQDSRAQIDPLLCVSCGICAQLCLQGAIVGVGT
jgi:indolepyruvate ferredoxin oxidoreductase alpha subunit